MSPESLALYDQFLDSLPDEEYALFQYIVDLGIDEYQKKLYSMSNHLDTSSRMFF